MRPGRGPRALGKGPGRSSWRRRVPASWGRGLGAGASESGNGRAAPAGEAGWVRGGRGAGKGAGGARRKTRAGAVWGSRCPGVGVAGARRGRAGAEEQVGARGAGRGCGAGIGGVRGGTGVRGPLREPCAPRRVRSLAETRRTRGPGRGGSSKCAPLAVRPPPPGTTRYRSGARGPVAGSGLGGSLLAPAVAVATRPHASSGYIYSNYYHDSHCVCYSARGDNRGRGVRAPPTVLPLGRVGAGCWGHSVLGLESGSQGGWPAAPLGGGAGGGRGVM